MFDTRSESSSPGRLEAGGPQLNAGPHAAKAPGDQVRNPTLRPASGWGQDQELTKGMGGSKERHR